MTIYTGSVLGLEPPDYWSDDLYAGYTESDRYWVEELDRYED